MTAYYNENDPYAAQWLRNLIVENLIAHGDVDDRSIVDVRPADLKGYLQCHFFAGIGGWSGALRKAGWPDDHAVWTGSCPCQPFSLAGKQKGFADERHLWPVWRELIRECKASVVFGEQVASATDWLRLVRSDLETLGYTVGAIPIQAASAGADHLRDRYWFMAYPNNKGSQGWELLSERPNQRIAGSDGVADADEPRAGEEWQQRSGQFSGAGGDQEARSLGNSQSFSERKPHDESNAYAVSGQAWPVFSGTGNYEWVVGGDGKARRVKPGICLLAHGIPARVAKLRALGNAIDLRPATEFIIAAREAICL